MTSRRFGKSVPESTKKSSQRRRETRRNEFWRKLSRSLTYEPLEGRLLLATGPQLFAIRPNDGALLDAGGGTVLDVAPRELDFMFKGGADIDYNTLPGIRITRSGADGAFDVASTESDFGTNGAVVIEFAAAKLGTGQNNVVQVAVTESDHRDASDPLVTVAGTVITVDLNRNSAHPTTANDLVEAINNTPAASARSGPAWSAASAGRDLTTAILDPASATTDFGTGNYEVRFTVRQSGMAGNNLRVVVTKSDHGNSSGPTVSVAGQTITADLNTNTGHESTTQQLVDAINNHATAGQMVVAEVVPIALVIRAAVGSAGFGGRGHGQRTRQRDDRLRHGGAVRLKFTAVTPGVAGNTLQIAVQRADLGLVAPPTVTAGPGGSR